MANMRRNVMLAGWVTALVGLIGTGATAATERSTHPELSAQEMLIDCADCHREATPEVEKEWFGSVHGIAMVKCYQCHGTFEAFAVTPTRATCGTCHAEVVAKSPPDKPCWGCHVPHTFKDDKHPSPHPDTGN